MDGAVAGLVLLAVLVVFAVIVVAKSVALIPQAEAAVIERLGRYSKTVSGQLTLLLPFVDRIRARVDLRERVVSFPPQPVITEDNLTVNIDTVVYFQVTNPQAAVYQISNYIVGVEQLTTTTLRNVVGGMTLEQTLTSRDQINGQLRGVLDEATGRWGLRVARVELRSIDPPPSIQDSMEKQMRADREKRAMILTAEGSREASIKQAEGQKQAQILSAEGAKQAAILAAEADRQSRMLRAQGERAARTCRRRARPRRSRRRSPRSRPAGPTPEMLAYQYLQTLPQMAKGEANKVWLVPSDFGTALEGFTKMLGAPGRGRGVPVPAVAGRGEPAQAGGRLRRGGRVVQHEDRPRDRAGGRQGGGRGTYPGGRVPRCAAAVRAAVAAGAAAGDRLLPAAGAAAAARRPGSMSGLTSPRIYAALAALQAGDAVACAVPIAPIEKAFDDVGLAPELRPLIPFVKVASAIGLLSVYRFPGIGAAHHVDADRLLRAGGRVPHQGQGLEPRSRCSIVVSRPVCGDDGERPVGQPAVITGSDESAGWSSDARRCSRRCVRIS